jgi:hypothetical protein
VSVFFDNTFRERTFTFANTSGCGYSSGSRTANQAWPTRRGGKYHITSNPAASLAVGTQGQPGETIRKHHSEAKTGLNDENLAAVLP